MNENDPNDEPPRPGTRAVLAELEARAARALSEFDVLEQRGEARETERLAAALYHGFAALARLIAERPELQPFPEHPVRYYCHKCGGRLYVLPHQVKACGAPICCEGMPMYFGMPPMRYEPAR